MKWVLIFLLFIGTQSALPRPAEVIIIRHAEGPDSPSIHLSSKGQRRARALAFFFTTNETVIRHGQPVALFAPRPKPNGSRRSIETLLPTAQRLDLTIRQPFTEEQWDALARRILRN